MPSILKNTFLFSFILIYYIFNSKGFSQEEKKKVPVEIFADKITYYEDKKTVAQGNVIIKYEDVQIEAEIITIDDEKEEVHSQGKVKFQRGEEKLSGEEMKYSTKNKEGVIYSSQGVSLPFYFEGEKIIFKEKKIDISSAGTTTCNLSSPHYNILSKKVDIYPKDKLVARRIKFRLWDKTLFYFPMYVVSLKEKEKQPFTPRIGHDQREGWSVRTAYNYYLNINNYGTFYLDWVEKMGTGKGIKQNFKIKEKGETSLYLYHLKELDKNKTNLTMDMLYNYKLSEKTSVLSNIKYNNQRVSLLQEIKTLTSTFQWQKKTKRGTTTNTFNLRRIGAPIDTQDHRITLLQNYQHNKIRTNFYLDFSESKIKKEYPNQELNTKIEIKKQIGGGNINLLWQKRIDVDKEKNIKDKYLILNRQPEMTFFSSPLRHRRRTYPIKYSLLWGKYYEEPKNMKEDKFNLSANLNLQKSKKIINFNIPVNFSQDFYSTGEAKHQIQISPHTLFSYSKNLTHTVGWNYQYNRGPSPFSFDSYGKTNNISSEVKFSPGDKLKYRLASSYDFLSERYQPLQNYLDLMPSRELNASLSFDYDLHRRKYGNLSGTTTYDNKRDFSAKTFYLYNIDKRELLKIDGDISFKRIRGWDINYKTSYLPQAKKFAYNDFLVLRDLHCWEARITYRHYQREVSIELNIKAFPSEKVTLGVDESGLQYQTTLTDF